ncbi:MAG: polysaccharide deacetylase family protein [Clostridia bacterium]|nr:polysaccharide deacetylase family protein [Clostridia bacterium]
MKKIFIRATALFLVLSALVSVPASAAEKSFSWSTVRNGNLQPKFPPELSAVENYGGYYLDRSHGDDSDDKVLYLTFDAGYENGNIAKILDVMKEKGVTGAFFVLDHLIIKNPELIKRMKNEGHLVCNHTKNHKDLSFATKDEIKNDLEALEKICRDRVGFELDKYFRFPEGKYSLSALKHVRDLGYKTVFWSFAYYDWDNKNQPKKATAIKKILSNTHNGAVILLHPTSETNAAILGELISAWQKSGYRFGTLDELTK